MSTKDSRQAKKLRRLHVVYSGRVQGVGFRYTAEALAQDAGLKGWVRNLTGGDVEITAEGEEKHLIDFLKAVRSSSLGRYIQKERADWLPHKNEFSDFRIEFCY